METTDIIPGMEFSSIHFEGKAEVLEVDQERNEVRVKLHREGSTWIETWDLQNTVWGFERREYKELPVQRLGGQNVMYGVLDLLNKAEQALKKIPHNRRGS